jgi:putative Holliday junction resolvase
MRYLGIDYGTKKIGLALSDESAGFAFPYSIILKSVICEAVSEIKKVCDEHGVEKIVLGKPELFNIKDDKIVNKIEKFKQELEKEIGLPVVFENEALTTQQAKRPFDNARKKPKHVDASAAALILQSYLDKRGKK